MLNRKEEGRALEQNTHAFGETYRSIGTSLHLQLQWSIFNGESDVDYFIRQFQKIATANACTIEVGHTSQRGTQKTQLKIVVKQRLLLECLSPSLSQIHANKPGTQG